jgi:hypothetical protein
MLYKRYTCANDLGRILVDMLGLVVDGIAIGILPPWTYGGWKCCPNALRALLVIVWGVSNNVIATNTGDKCNRICQYEDWPGLKANDTTSEFTIRALDE